MAGRTTNALHTRCWDGIAATPGAGAGDSHPLIVAVPAEPTKESIDIIRASGTSPRTCCQSLPEERDLIFEVKYARRVGIALIHVVVDREPDLRGLDRPESEHAHGMGIEDTVGTARRALCFFE